MRSERIRFDNGRGQQLAAQLDRPLRDQPRGYALFAHCFTCSKRIGAAVNLSRALVEHGWAMLRFDFTGLGNSEGEFGDTHFSSNVQDVVQAGRWLAQHREAPRLLIGHSLGGAAVLRAAHHLASVTAVATLAAPSHPDHVLRLLTAELDTIETDGEAEVELAGRRFTIKRSFLDDLHEQSMREAIATLDRPLLILHAPKDDTVGIENAAHIFKAAKHPKSFVSLDDADHLLNHPVDGQFAASIIATWAQRYLPSPVVPTDVEPLTAWGPEQGFTTEITVGEHDLVADEPTSVGGDNRGPNPYDYLLASLGGCTVMTLRMYASRKRWPLQRAVCHLRHGKVHARDSEHCEDNPNAMIDRIERVIDLQGDLDPDQRRRLMEIADRCPIHRMLSDHRLVIATREGEA